MAALLTMIRPRDLGRAMPAVAAVRAAAGAVLVMFSFGKFIHHDAEVAAFDRYGIPLPEAATTLTGVLELVGGLLLVAGLFTRPVALAFAAELALAVATAGRIEGGAVHLGLAPALIAAMLALAWAGAGRPSVDALLATRPARAEGIPAATSPGEMPGMPPQAAQKPL